MILLQLQDDSYWHLVAFWSWKLILVETHYETYNQELLAIIVAFKHWHHYLEGFTYIVEVLTDYNNLVAF